jgi:hypothetical protein
MAENHAVQMKAYIMYKQNTSVKAHYKNMLQMKIGNKMTLISTQICLWWNV